MFWNKVLFKFIIRLGFIPSLIGFMCRNGLPVGYTVQQAKEFLASQAGVDINSIVDSAETTEQVKCRQSALLDMIKSSLLLEPIESDTNPDHPMTAGAHQRRVLLVSHGGFIKSFLRDHCHHAFPGKIRNGSVTIVNVEVREDGRFDCSLHDRVVNCTQGLIAI